MKRIKVRIVSVLFTVILLVSGCMPSIYIQGVDYSDYPDRKVPVYDDAVVYSFDGDKNVCEIEYGTNGKIDDISEFYREEFEDEDYTILNISDEKDDEFHAEGYIDDIYFEIKAEEASGEPEDYFESTVTVKIEEYTSEEIEQSETEEKNPEPAEVTPEPEGNGANSVEKDIKLLGEAKIADFDWDSISDDIIAAYDEGMAYYEEGKYRRAAEDFTLCAEAGHPTAQGMLGDCYYYGEGVERNLDTAIYWYTEGALQGDELSQYSLGYMYLYGEGVKKDVEGGIYLTESAANQGYLAAQDFLGWCYEYGQYVDWDLEQAAYWYGLVADQDNVRAIIWMGEYYFFEMNEGDTDYQKAVEYFERAIELEENLDAYYYIALSYYLGIYYEQDYQQAIDYLQYGVDAEDSRSQYLMGELYYFGNGVERDYEQAAYYYELAAEQGLPIAMNNFGDLYETGLGVEQDYDLAFYWYSRAVVYGDGVAQYNMGHFYYEGWSVERDYDMAAYYYKLSAEQGTDVGQWGLGICYENGHGVALDLPLAKYWYQLAADQGLDEAIEALKGLEDVEAATEPEADDSQEGMDLA